MLKKIAVLGSSTLLLFLILEITLRILHPPQEEGWAHFTMGEPNTKYHHGHDPNDTVKYIGPEFNTTVHFNTFGFRGENFSLEKPEGMKRVFVLGDSFTFGTGVGDEETIPHLLEKFLKQKHYAVQIINAGHGSYSPLLHYLKLRDIYLKFKPDLVILLFDMTDLRDDWLYEQELVYDKDGTIVGCNPFFKNGKRDLWAVARHYSQTCKYIHNKGVRTFYKIKTLGLKTYLQTKLEGKRAKTVIANTQGIDSTNYDQFLLLRGKEKEELIRKHWPRTEKYLALIHELLKTKKIPFILSVYPHSVQVGPHQWEKGRIVFGFKTNEIYDDPLPFNLLKEFAQSYRIPFINTAPAVKKQAHQKLYFDWDGHFNALGYKVVAEALARDPVLLQTLKSIF